MNIIVGILSGTAASMGLGGGFVLLLYLSAFTNTPQDIAQGVNLLFFLPIAFLSMCIHIKSKLISFKTVFEYAYFGLLGCAVGSIIGLYLEVGLLRKLFAALLVIVGLREIFHKNTKENAARFQKIKIKG